MTRRETDGVLKGNGEKKEVQQKPVWKDSRKERRENKRNESYANSNWWNGGVQELYSRKGN
jgi:hypothetical protein